MEIIENEQFPSLVFVTDYAQYSKKAIILPFFCQEEWQMKGINWPLLRHFRGRAALDNMQRAMSKT